MTQSVVHLVRLLKWGRTLARHGALKGIERDPLTPPTVRRLVRVARFGARVPDKPAYADAFQAIGPAAVKLGQALATRPDLVGEDAAADLLRLQDALPPLPFAEIRASIEQALGRPIDELFASIEETPVGAASIAQVHRAVTTDGRDVAVKVLRPGVEEEFAKAIETYEWAAAQAESFGGEIARLRPRLVIATFRQWTARELDLRREAASASELAEAMVAEPGYEVPAIDWQRTARRVMTLEWIDGIKLSRRDELIAAGHDVKALASRLVRAFLRQAISEGFFHADMHQGNLLVRGDGSIVAIDFGIMGRIDRRARTWLAEILYGLLTGDYKRVAEIHFEAGYVPPHHSLGEFTTALRAVGEPIRGLPVKDISIGNMLDGLFAITRDFDMPTQPHLLLLQKTMVMVEGVATALDPDLNMWETSGPFVKEWMRTELGPEAYLADRLVKDVRTIARLPDLVRAIEARYPPPGGAPPPPPLRD
ncbi:MAG: 2-polyprenylphenol 6-hydroxylase, partial [Sphingomonas sanxanigenens]